MLSNYRLNISLNLILIKQISLLMNNIKQILKLIEKSA